MILQKAKKESAFLKMGLYGEAGSGKTFTSTRVAIGLYHYIKAEKPVAFADTETGSDFVMHLFEAEKIELLTAKTRAFKDLLDIVDEAEKNCSILIIDSITHFWNELIDSFMKKHQLTRLALKHWQPLKQTWREFTDRYVNSKLHIIVCGRSADRWDEVEDEEGIKELKKVGTKMRTETEMGYEPSLLVEMEAVQLSPKAGGQYVHRAYVKKDRFDVINGKTFDNPGFEEFLPHIELLNLGGEHKALEVGRNSQDIFDNENIGEKRILKREILLEKIGNEIKLLYPGQTEREKVARLQFMKEIFGTHSWTEVTNMKIEELEKGLKKIEVIQKLRAKSQKKEITQEVSNETAAI
jgi:hypothetical protein